MKQGTLEGWGGEEGGRRVQDRGGTCVYTCGRFMLIHGKTHQNVIILQLRQRLLHEAFLVAQTVKASAYNVGDPGLIPGSGRSPGEGNGNPLQYSCLENPMDGGA